MRRPLLSGAIFMFLCASGSEQPVWAGSGKSNDPECILSSIYENDQLLYTDHNYTFGGLVTHSCETGSGQSLDSVHSWSPLRNWNKSLFGELVGASDWKQTVSSIHFGLSLYTPNDLTIPRPGKRDGRPYASLLTFGDSILRANDTVAIKQGMQFGIMGLPIGGNIQSAVHEIFPGDDPQGWPTEISRGGEPVFSYGVQKQWRLCPTSYQCGDGDDHPFNLTGDVGASLGSYTGLRAGLSVRLGPFGGGPRPPFWEEYGSINRRHTLMPFRASRPVLFEAGPRDAISEPSSDSELVEAVERRGDNTGYFLFWTVGLEYVLHSAVLQGQFRENEYEIDSSDVERAVPYASVGAEMRFRRVRLSLSQNFRGPETEGGKSHSWTTISVECPF